LKKVWREAAELFWSRPSLWLPFAVADLAGLFLTSFRLWATRSIVFWLMSAQRSVLGGAPDPLINHPELVNKALMLTIPIGWLIYYLQSLLYSAAFLLTVLLVQNLQTSGGLQIDGALQAIWSIFGRLSVFALQFFLIVGICLAMITGIPAYFFGRNGILHWNSPVYLFIDISLAEIVIAYFVVPLSFRLMERAFASADNRGPDAVKQGRNFAYITGTVGTLLSLLLVAARDSLVGLNAPEHTFLRQMIDITQSLISSFPFVVLFILLGLLALRTDLEAPLPVESKSSSIHDDTIG
jgi:hypothetical protein